MMLISQFQYVISWWILVAWSAKKWMLPINIWIFYADNMLKKWWISVYIEIERYICTFYIGIQSLKYFQHIYYSYCKVRTQFVTCKTRWLLCLDAYNSKTKHNSGGGIGIQTDSLNSAVGNCSPACHASYCQPAITSWQIKKSKKGWWEGGQVGQGLSKFQKIIDIYGCIKYHLWFSKVVNFYSRPKQGRIPQIPYENQLLFLIWMFQSVDHMVTK